MDAKEYLRINLENEAKTYYGVTDKKYIDATVNAWINDKSNSKHRFDTIKEYMLEAVRVLDMASGCGTCVFYGLLNGYDMYGIDPEEWKHVFNGMKAREYNYPTEWMDRFSRGVGENLPYEDNNFDCVTSYQTLEHVQDVNKALYEMIRVTKIGGGIHIRCPDYTSTYEGHYRLPWLPMMPRGLAYVYLKLLGKPLNGLRSINYVTAGKIRKILNEICLNNPEWKLRIINVERPSIKSIIRHAFRKEYSVNLFIYVELK